MELLPGTVSDSLPRHSALALGARHTTMGDTRPTGGRAVAEPPLAWGGGQSSLLLPLLPAGRGQTRGSGEERKSEKAACISLTMTHNQRQG
jgi:hypothetical protein